MVQVSFTDSAAGRWGFITTVTFTLPRNKPNPGGDLILKVSMKSEVLDCDGEFLRLAPPDFNYGPLIENFGPFENATAPICDFHMAYGRLVDDSYNANETIRITVDGEVWMQRTKDSAPKGKRDAFIFSTPADQARPRASEMVPTGKKWTTPGMIQARDPANNEGELEGDPLTEKTTYTYVYTWSKCGEEETWSGSVDSSTHTPVAFLDLDAGGGLLALSKAQAGHLTSLVAALETGATLGLLLQGEADYRVLLATANVGARTAAQLSAATPVEAFVLTTMLRDLNDARAVGALIAAIDRFGDAESVVFTALGIGHESWLLDQVADEALRTIAKQAGISTRLPPESDKPNVMEWRKWCDSMKTVLPNQWA